MLITIGAYGWSCQIWCRLVFMTLAISCELLKAVASYLVCWDTTARRLDLQKVKVKGQGQGHEGHKILKILKLQYLPHFFWLEGPYFPSGTLQLCPSCDVMAVSLFTLGTCGSSCEIWCRLLFKTFHDLGDFLWTIEGSCIKSCVLTHYRKTSWLAKGQSQRLRSRSKGHKILKILKLQYLPNFF